jgi:nucleoside-diphosphate-sugar epimerase/glycosyltransferase involved in cell wall biosynthesis
MISKILTHDQELIHSDAIRKIQGPIVVIGVGGFIGSVAFHTLQNSRADVYGIARDESNWRTTAIAHPRIRQLDLRNQKALEMLLGEIRPRTIFNFSAVGAYPTQHDLNAMIEINIKLLGNLGQWCLTHSCVLIHSGTSSEYGSNCSGPTESDTCSPNSAYSATKLAGTHLLQQLGREEGFRCVVLRFYSIYGPLEDSSRLIPTLIRKGLEGLLPDFSSSRISRDFTYVVDALEAAWLSAIHAQKNTGTFVFNIGTGVSTDMSDVARIAKEIFSIKNEPTFAGNLRQWDLEDWYSNPRLAAITLGWHARTSFMEGLNQTLSWYQQSHNREFLLIGNKVSKSEHVVDCTLSAIVACYKDEQAIPIMYDRLVATFQRIGCEYEIVFVNDASPDNSAAELEKLISIDPRVTVITHMRNFGSQAAFISGMQASKGDACVLLDGDLQDPPELLFDFYRKWREGFDVVYGVRKTREASAVMQIAYKSFYKIYSSMSGFPIPRDAGDFSLMSRQVVNELLKFPERDLFLRTNRAYIGGRQVGVPYHRPERAFGTTTNSPFRNLQWAVRGVLSSSRKPLSALSLAGISTAVLSVLGLLVQLALRLAVPNSAPRGIVTVILLVGVFGSMNLLAISVVGEYVGRILDEVRGRPRYIHRSIKKSANDS